MKGLDKAKSKTVAFNESSRIPPDIVSMSCTLSQRLTSAPHLLHTTNTSM